MFGMKQAKAISTAHEQAEQDDKLRTKVRQLLEQSKWTPDMAQLVRKQVQHVFLADEFQRGHPKHELIKANAVFLGKVDTVSPFNVWKRSLGEESYPIAMKEDKFTCPSWQLPRKGDTGIIRGELFATDSYKVIALLDKHRQNGLQFRRERALVQLRYRVKSYSLRDGWHHSDWRVQPIEAWMYVGEPDYWNWEGHEFGYMDSVRMFKPNDEAAPVYYKFTKAEYDD